MILIGSGALAANGYNVKVNDLDVIANEEEKWGVETFIHGGHKLEFHDVNFMNNADVQRLFTAGTVTIGDITFPYANLSGLAALKRSHLWRDHFFEKHMAQYNHFQMGEYVKNLSEEELEFMKERTRLTKEAFPQGNPRLNQSNEDFFDDAVKKLYDHDYLHELVAFGGAPVYTMMKRDVDKAWCEKDMWDVLPHEHKVQCVAEETYVIAMERFLIPKDWKASYKGAYSKALKKVCTTLTSGWFRDFAIDNYPAVMYMFDRYKIDKVKEELK